MDDTSEAAATQAPVTKNFGPADYKNEPAPKIGNIVK